MEGVVLNKGAERQADSPRSNGGSPAALQSALVKMMAARLGGWDWCRPWAPAIDASLDPHAWMVELALERLKADGENFYEGRCSAFTAALRQGMQASVRRHDSAHRFINLDVPLSFNMHVMVLPVLKDATDEQGFLKAIGRAIESAVLGEACALGDSWPRSRDVCPPRRNVDCRGRRRQLHVSVCSRRFRF